MPTNNNAEHPQINGHKCGDQNAGLSARDESLAMALARGLSLRDAADASGVKERTAYRRRKTPEFKQRLRTTWNDLMPTDCLMRVFDRHSASLSTKTA